MKEPPTFQREDWLIISLLAVVLVGFIYSVR